MIQCKNLKHQYPGGSEIVFPDFKCEKGSRLLILGDSGKGKTTLLHLMSGLLRLQSGSIQIEGVELADLSNEELDRFRGQEIGLVFQSAHFVASLTVIENILLAPYLSGKAPRKDRAMEILTRLNVDHKANKLPAELSVGERQRVSIARAIINNPSIIFADEPTSALDDRNTHEVIKLLEEQAALSGASLIIVTHDNRLKSEIQNCIEL